MLVTHFAFFAVALILCSPAELGINPPFSLWITFAVANSLFSRGVALWGELRGGYLVTCGLPDFIVKRTVAIFVLRMQQPCCDGVAVLPDDALLCYAQGSYSLTGMLALH